VEVDGGRAILRGASVEVRGGEVVALVGPNGAGKSTLVGVLSGDLDPVAGEVRVDGEPLHSWTGGELALRRSVLPQAVGVTFPFTVRQVVEMGRAPWVVLDGDPDGEAVVEESLRRADVVHLADRTFPTLSGGERSRAALARVLAQDTRVLLLDEPTAALDLHHQEMVLRLARERASLGVAVVVVLHDLGLAAAHADRIVVLDGGQVVVAGTPSDVLQPALLTEVYRHAVEVLTHPRTGELIVLPVRADPLP
jgi:iron complex transport system ATP-binding protein